MESFKPMLAGSVDLEKVVYPVLCTPKYDGVRCLVRDGQVVSRQLKPIPNDHVRSLLSGLPDGLDGELILPKASFNTIQSRVMSVEGKPRIKYHVFDVVRKVPYDQRMIELEEMDLPKVCVKVLPVRIRNQEALLKYEQECVDKGYEGIMVRSLRGPYKFGRSTTKEGYLLKMKRFVDAEAKIVGFEELMHNENVATVDNLGHTKRSSHHAGKVPAGTLGCFVVENDEGKQFKVSTGMTAGERQDYWGRRDEMIGKWVKYKYQEAGGKTLPRFPVFLGIRPEEDM